MSLSDDQIEGAWVMGDDFRHRRDHVLEALARIDQAEGRQDRTVLDAELALQSMPSTRLDRRHAVLDYVRALLDPVHVGEQTGRGLCHDDDPRAVLRNTAHGFADLRLRLGQHGVERGDDRLLEGFEERHAVILVDAVPPNAVQTEFVLEIHGVDRRFIDRARGAAIALLIALLDAPADIRAVRTGRVGLVDRGSHTTYRRVGRLYGRHQICGKCRDSAAPGNSGSDKGNPHYTILQCQRFLDWQRHT